MFVHDRTHRRMLAAVLAFAAPAFLLTACNDDPLFDLPPDPPTNVAAVVNGQDVTINWTPGANATSQEVRLAPVVPVPLSAGNALQAEDYVAVYNDNTTDTHTFTDVEPGAYTATVTAINASSRAPSEIATVTVQEPAGDAPVITAFYADEQDPTTLIVEWTGVEGAENYQVTLTADDDSGDFSEIAGASATSFPFSPVNDGTTYTAQVCLFTQGAGVGECSATQTFTADFFPWDEWFPTSLHETGQGKITYYAAENGGFEGLINIPYEQADCIGCHSSTDGRPPVSGRTCDRCHATANPTLGDDTVDEPAVCLGCHGRQNAEINLGLPDVHRDAGFTCMSCHTSEDVHGDGTSYASFQEIGAIDARCTNCHDPDDPVNPFVHPAGNPHGEAVGCVACHATGAPTCNNCHFEAELSGDGKVFYGPPKADWLWLGNRPKRDGSGETEVYPVNFQSVKYEDNSFVAWGHYTPHAIGAGRDCTDCHANFGGTIPAIEQYNEFGILSVAVWDDGIPALTFPLTGVVPWPADYETSTQFDFVTTSVLPPVWEFLESGPDAHQSFDEYATPLSVGQMQSLGMVAPGP